MSHAIYCDRCGRESRGDIEPHEERNIRPGPATLTFMKEDHEPYYPEIEFIRLDEHQKTTGDRIWCGPCWDEVTASEVSPYWKRAFEVDSTQVDMRWECWRRRRKHQHWQKARCLECGQWLEVCMDFPTVETTRYTLLLETAGQPIDGWFYGVLFEGGKPIDIRCPKHSRKAA